MRDDLCCMWTLSLACLVTGIFKRLNFSHNLKSCCQITHFSHLRRLIVQIKRPTKTGVEVSNQSYRLEGRISVFSIIFQIKSHVCVFIPLWRILWGLKFTSARWAATLVQKNSTWPSPSQHCTCMCIRIKVVPYRNFYCLLGPSLYGINVTQHSYFTACTLFSMAAALALYNTLKYLCQLFVYLCSVVHSVCVRVCVMLMRERKRIQIDFFPGWPPELIYFHHGKAVMMSLLAQLIQARSWKIAVNNANIFAFTPFPVATCEFGMLGRLENTCVIKRRWQNIRKVFIFLPSHLSLGF